MSLQLSEDRTFLFLKKKETTRSIVTSDTKINTDAKIKQQNEIKYLERFKDRNLTRENMATKMLLEITGVLNKVPIQPHFNYAYTARSPLMKKRYQMKWS